MAAAYHDDPDTDFHQMVADMAGITRKQAKTIGLGLMYGMGKAKLAVSLDLQVDEASEAVREGSRTARAPGRGGAVPFPPMPCTPLQRVALGLQAHAALPSCTPSVFCCREANA